MHTIFFKDLIQKIRHRITYRLYGYRIISKGNNNLEIDKDSKKFLILKVIGNNNKIKIKKINASKTGLIMITIFGDNCELTIDDNLYVSTSLNILMGLDHSNFGKINNSRLNIANNISIESMTYVTFNSNSYCNIQKDCMFSYDITLYNTDAHPIFDKITGKVINKVRGIEIGEHSWIGRGATILKNSIIPCNSIIGWNAVFSGGGGIN